MRTSEDGIARIRERQGCNLTPYQDGNGVWRNGYANEIGVVANGPPITPEQAETDLRRNLGYAEVAVMEAEKITAPLEPHQFDALVSHVMRAGYEAFNRSDLRKAVYAGDMEAAAAELPEDERGQFKGVT